MPSPGLKIAFDPRIPESLRKIPFEVEGGAESEKIIWTLNGEVIGEGNKLLWPISRGSFLLKANQGVRQAEEVRFYVR